MSCGNPHEVDCGEVLRHLQEFLDHEIDDNTTCAELQQHLEECAPCLREQGMYDMVKKRLGCCGGEVASAEFKVRLRTTLAAVQIDVTTVEIRGE
jgi:anti-sigma factor (TIGR02949 family)